jgi:hypothetical protein
MGTWSNEPWGNDAAADWYGQLMQKTQLADHVRSALTRDPEEHSDVILAAAHTLLQFAHVYVWPIEHLESDLQLGREALKKLLADPDIPKAPIKKWDRELQARLASIAQAGQKSKSKPKTSPIANVQASRAERFVLRHLWSVDLIKAGQRTKAHEQMSFDDKNGTVLQIEVIDDSRLLVVSGEWFAVLDSATGKAIWRQDEIELNIFLRKVFVANDEYFVVSGPGPQTTLRDLRTGDSVKRFKHPGATSAALSASGDRLIVMTFDETLEVYDLPLRKHLLTLKHKVAGIKDIGHCAITPDGKFAISKWQKALAIWDLDRGEQIGKMAGVLTARFTRDMQQLVCIKSNGGVVFDLNKGKIDRKLTKDQLQVDLHSPDGRFNVTLGRARFNYFVSSVTAIDSSTPTLELDKKHWLDDRSLLLPYVSEDCVEVGLQVWNVDPIEVISRFAINAELIAEACGSPNYAANPDITRCIVDRHGMKIYVGDQDHHIHALDVRFTGR